MAAESVAAQRIVSELHRITNEVGLMEFPENKRDGR